MAVSVRHHPTASSEDLVLEPNDLECSLYQKACKIFIEVGILVKLLVLIMIFFTAARGRSEGNFLVGGMGSGRLITAGLTETPNGPFTESALDSETDISLDSSFDDDAREDIQEILEVTLQIRLANATPLHQEFFGPDLSGRGYVNILQEVERYYFEKSEDPTEFAYYSASRKGIVLTDGFFQGKLSLLEKLSILIHEAIHAKNPDSTHFICPKNDLSGKLMMGYLSGQPLEGISACDIFYNHAYGVQATLLYNLAKFCTSCSPWDKARAQFASQEMRNRIVIEVSRDILVNDQK